MFNKKQQPNFIKVKALIEQKMDEFHSPAPTHAPADVADQIKRLADLRDSGILTNEEFDAKKKQLLGI